MHDPETPGMVPEAYRPLSALGIFDPTVQESRCPPLWRPEAVDWWPSFRAMSWLPGTRSALIVSPKIDATVSAELQYAVSTERIVLEQRGFRCRDVRRKDFPRPSAWYLDW